MRWFEWWWNAPECLLGADGGVYLQALRRSSKWRSKSEGLEEELDSTLGTAMSPLFIEVEGCRAVVMAHLPLAVTKS